MKCTSKALLECFYFEKVRVANSYRQQTSCCADATIKFISLTLFYSPFLLQAAVSRCKLFVSENCFSVGQ